MFLLRKELNLKYSYQLRTSFSKYVPIIATYCYILISTVLTSSSQLGHQKEAFQNP